MLFKPVNIILALVAAVHVLAAPATAERADDNLVVIQSQPYGNGTLVAYGNAPSAVTPRSESAPLCGSNAVTCSGSHQADINTCLGLITAVQNSPAILGSSPRALCLTQGGNQCCISWSIDIGVVAESNLFNAAVAVFNTCLNNRISGLARDVTINGQCLTQCLSDRPSGCS